MRCELKCVCIGVILFSSRSYEGILEKVDYEFENKTSLWTDSYSWPETSIETNNECWLCSCVTAFASTSVLVSLLILCRCSTRCGCTKLTDKQSTTTIVDFVLMFKRVGDRPKSADIVVHSVLCTHRTELSIDRNGCSVVRLRWGRELMTDTYQIHTRKER